jgi:hypothetical protein
VWGLKQEVRNLHVMQMRLGQSAEKLKLLSDLERSAVAEAKLRLKALQWARGNLQLDHSWLLFPPVGRLSEPPPSAN